VPGYEFSFWTGIGAPRNTPIEIVEKLNQEINAALADPNMKARLAGLGVTGLPGSPADFGKLIAEETEKWGKVAGVRGGPEFFWKPRSDLIERPPTRRSCPI
jgi:tripartite-type tricarboxylate transporter receptor subunit TctC